MKQLCIIATFFITLGSFAQSGFNTGQFPVKGQLVKVKDWGSRALMILSDNYFSATRDSIIYQVGQEEFDELKNRCAANGWPEGLYVSGVSDEEDKAFDAKLNRLKMYRIAAYTHIYNGKTFDRYAILRVPYEENKDWDLSVKWTGNLYFLLKEADVETIQ
ncbi:MAG TPA: hypothetical protein VFV31_00280 [Chitinophagaceae bacterium]|nr:hypothetical protein [Chitinophagaceae bacterium]